MLCRGVPSKMVRLGLTQIDLIIQIYYFLCGFCDFCEILFFLSPKAQNGKSNKRRRCLTMLNRWWSDSATCGERIPHYHSASKMSNNVVPLRGTLLLVPPLRRLHPKGACQRLSMVQRLRRFAPMWGCRKHPEYHNRGAVADPAAMGDLRRMPLPCKQQLLRLIANRHIQNAKSVK